MDKQFCDRDCCCECSCRLDGNSCSDLADRALFPELAQETPDEAACTQLTRSIQAVLKGADCCEGCQGSTAARTVFHGRRQPSISIQDYIQRLAKFSKCSPICFVMALIYIDKLQQKNAVYAPCSLSIHRLLLVSVMVAAKLTDDRYFNNACYAKIGGVPTDELNVLERELLHLLDYRMFVPQHQLWQHVLAIKALASSASPASQPCRVQMAEVVAQEGSRGFKAINAPLSTPSSKGAGYLVEAVRG